MRNTFCPPQFRLSRQTPFVPSLAIIVLTLAVIAVGTLAIATRTCPVSITNTGQRDRDEVVQMYMHQRVASVTRPVLELRGFQRGT